MSIFGIDEDLILSTVADALDQSGSSVSEEQFTNIADAIEESMPGVIEILTYGMQEHWKSEARDTPTGWGEKYANAIKAKVSGNKGEVYVDESLIDKTSNKPVTDFIYWVENGMQSFSIKDALMKSEKAKTGIDSNGNTVKYMTIPFPISTPRKASQGKQSSKFGGREMTKAAYNIVKQGGNFSGALKSGLEVSGLTRYVSAQRHRQYGIFIRVSENSKGWIHPGKMATPVYPKVLSEVNTRIQEVLSEFCKGVVKEFTS